MARSASLRQRRTSSLIANATVPNATSTIHPASPKYRCSMYVGMMPRWNAA